MIKAVLFDFDGTLADTNPLIIKTFKETFATLLPDQPFTDSEIINCIGPTLEQTGRKYFPEDPETFVNVYRELNGKYHDEMIKIYPGILEMVSILKEKGLKLAVVSSKRRDFVVRGLRQTGLLDFFDYIVAADDVNEPKPDAEGILKAMNHYGVTQAECLMVGDNSHDVDAAKNAGVKGIAVGWAFKGVDYLAALEPDYLVMDAMEIVEIIDELK